MDRLEEQLRGALGRKDPSPGFAERIAETAAAGGARGSTAPRWWMAAAAMVLMTVGTGVAYRRHQGEVAKEQVMAAVRITAVKLHHVQAHVREVRP